MKAVLEETDRRREIQMEYNKKHGITPTTVIKELKPLVDPSLISNKEIDLNSPMDGYGGLELMRVADDGLHYKPNPAMKEVVFEDKNKFLDYLRESMITAARSMEFEEAARIRDQIEKLKNEWK